MFVLMLRRYAQRGILGVSLLGMLMLAAGAHAADFPDLTLPDSMRIEIVADAIEVNGVQTRIYAFRTPDSADSIAAYFSRYWRGRMARAQAAGWDVLSHRDDGHLITVQMAAGQVEGTQGYIAFADLYDVADRGGKRPKPSVPLLSGTQVHQDMRANDHGRQSQTLVLTSRQSASQNLDFYRSFYERQGYEPLARGALAKADRDGVMMLNRGADEVNVVATQRDGETVVLIVTVNK